MGCDTKLALRDVLGVVTMNKLLASLGFLSVSTAYASTDNGILMVTIHERMMSFTKRE
jgi:hypothetical protein